MIDRFILICMKAIDSFSFYENQKVELLSWLKYCGEEAINLHNSLKGTEC